MQGLRAASVALARLDREVDDAVRIDRIRALEDLKAACAAAQARDAADLDASRRRAEAAAGVPGAERGRGVGAEVALARRESPNRGGRYLGLARALVHEMPCTLAALESGRLSEWRATVLVRETAVLTAQDRRTVDEELAGTAAALDTLGRLGDRGLAARARQVAYRLDARSVVERARRAETQRCVTLRPAPDAMAYLTALLPVRDAVTAHVALTRAAEAARQSGDPRSRGQLMADTLVAALAASAPAAGEVTWAGADTDAVDRALDMSGTPPRTPRVGLSVRLVMTDRALLGRSVDAGHEEPARLEGYGTVAAPWARALVAAAIDDGAGVWVKRLLTDEVGALVAMDPRSRRAPAGLADLVRTRDLGTCRRPWCDAPARHVDHVVPHSRGGPTTARNTQALCEACNQTKEVRGWSSRVLGPPGLGMHRVRTATPTGHTYDSTAPPLPGGSGVPVDGVDSPVEQWLLHRLALVG